ncbi:beta-N-acetylhexosaminidase [Sphingomonas deserti]|uniref:beta-N-acetylhexosaminidase n=2 Tax=Allosphingosinicella deserti TaxID=2116704 RepID=A0A2P7QKY5_9SPHN|nr:beta-N-acetylhexosaminidase [Sphingomonas deserti]
MTAPAQVCAAVSQDELDRIARDMDLRFTVVDNQPGKCPDGAGGCFLSEIELRLPERLPQRFASEDLPIYFSLVARLQRVDSDLFEADLVNGDLHVLRPKRGARLEGGRTYRIKLWSAGHFYSAYYPMPNFYLAPAGLGARVIAATRPVVDPETGLETLPFVGPMTNEAKLATGSADDATTWRTPERAYALYARNGALAKPDVAILPTPATVKRLQGAPLDLRGGVRLRLAGADRGLLQTALNRLVASGVGGLDRGPELRIDVAPGAGLAAESYRIAATTAGIRIRAADAAGAGHALRSLAQQVAFEEGRLRPIEIADAPRLPFRGLHVDVARNFHSKAEILLLLEQMANYKLNRLHLHLGDDEGWRLEIKTLPELAQVGGFRCHDPSETRCLQPQLGAGPDGNGPVNGYYSQADYLEILGAATVRGIEVIPSFDMPGHSRAAIRSMEARYRRLSAAGDRAGAELYRLVEPTDKTRYRSIQNYDDNTLNVCLDSTYRFVDTVVGELATLHRAAGVPLKTYHIGADETAGAWSESPACKTLMASSGQEPKQLGAMFIEKVAASLAAKDIEVAGWSDGLGHTDAKKMPRAVQSNIWGSLFGGGVAEAHDHANRGWRTVISVPNVTYLDSPYAPDPMERGYDWPSRDSDTFKAFAFMPENLAANASVMQDLQSRGTRIDDKTPLRAGRRIEGLQGQIWSETVRSDDQVEYMLFPRLIALAERAWHKGDWEPAYTPGAAYAFGDGKVNQAALLQDWRRFASRMGVHQAFLDDAGIDYRLAPPGGRIEAGMLHANSEFPGTPIEYREGGGAWRSYTGPVAVKDAVELRTRSPNGRRASRAVPLGQ